jgi:hypothetical protein
MAPGGHSGWLIDLGADASAARAVQRSAVAAHASQSVTLPLLRRRLDLLDGRERLRWLVRPAAGSDLRR